MQNGTEAEQFIHYMEARLEPGWQVAKFELENKTESILRIIIEPYGSFVELPPDGQCIIAGTLPIGEMWPISMLENNHLQIWAEWNKGWIEVFQDGEGYGITSEFVEWRRELPTRNQEES